MLLSLDAIPKPVVGGYGCDLCIDEKQVWQTREDYWADHLFAPFLLWVNEKLANSSTLNLYGSQDCSTWAVLMVSNSSEPNRMPVQILHHPINKDSNARVS
jgi:hypothetical protein